MPKPDSQRAYRSGAMMGRELREFCLSSRHRGHVLVSEGEELSFRQGFIEGLKPKGCSVLNLNSAAKAALWLKDELNHALSVEAQKRFNNGNL